MRKNTSFLFLLMVSVLLFHTEALCKELSLGIIPRRPAPDTMKMFKPLAERMSEEIGVPVKIKFSKDFKSFVADVKKEKFDIAHIGISHYLFAKKSGYRLIAKNEEFGKSTLTSVIYVRKDSNFKTLTDLKGKRIVFGGGKKALMPYIAPIYKLWQDGINPDEYTSQLAKNPYNAIYAVYKGAGAAGCASDITLDLPNVKGKINTDELAGLGELGPFPHLPWVASKQVDDVLFKKIQDYLLNLDKSAEGKKILAGAKLTGIRAAQDEEYKIVADVIKKVTSLTASDDIAKKKPAK